MRISDWSSDVCSSDLVRVFGDRFHILRYDTRGHGGSHAPPAPYSFADLEADAIGVLDAFEIERAHFVGLSLGGMIALGLAINHPDRLHSIAVCDARPDSPPAFRAPWDEPIAVARRTEGRRVGKECVRTCRSLVAPCH